MGEGPEEHASCALPTWCGGSSQHPSAWPAPLLLVDSEHPPCSVPGPGRALEHGEETLRRLVGERSTNGRLGMSRTQSPPSPRRGNGAVRGSHVHK